MYIENKPILLLSYPEENKDLWTGLQNETASPGRQKVHKQQKLSLVPLEFLKIDADVIAELQMKSLLSTTPRIQINLHVFLIIIIKKRKW